MFVDPEIKQFLSWLDLQIDRTIDGEDTPLNFIIHDYLREFKNCPLSIADATCYLIVETIIDLGVERTIELFNIKFDRYVSNEEFNLLLLEIPIRFLVLML